MMEKFISNTAVDERKKIVAYLRSLENVLLKEMFRTEDPQLKARRGIYGGMADDIEEGKHNRG